MKNGKEFYFPKGRRGSKGEPAVPPKDTSKETQNIQCMMNDSSPSMKLDSEILYLASVIL